MNIYHYFLILFTLFLNTSTTFIVQSPQELVNILKEKHPDGIPYSVANYGDVPFGKKMSATIVIGTYL